MIHLDTSFLIRALRPGSSEDRTLRRWLRTAEPLRMSSIVWAEFLCGPLPERTADLARTLVGEIVPFTKSDAVVAATLFNETGRRRGTFADCMIGAVAIRENAALATSNASDFARMKAAGLRVATAR